MSKGHLSESATKKLVNLLIERGYFHQDIDPQLADPDQKLSDICAFSETDVACQLVTTKDDTVMTRDQLKTCLMDQLALVGGRMSVQDATVALGVDAQHIEYVSNELIRVGNDLITEDYLDTMGERTNLELTKQDGHVVISELASNVWNMPMELTLSALEERIASEIITARILGLLGMKVLVTPDFEEREKCRIRGAFQAITLPTHVDTVCHEFHWDCDYVVPILQSLCHRGDVAGEVHASEDSCLTQAQYIPTIYLKNQRKSVDEFFASNGYITAQDCLAMGILESKMGDYVQETNPSAIVLRNTVILRDVVVSPLEQALVEAIASESFLDLRMHLPDSLLQYEEDVQAIVQEMALPTVKEGKDEGGRIVISDGEVLFVSTAMIRHIAKTLLPPLIESFAKTRAETLKSWSASNDNAPNDSTTVQSPKRKGRKTSKRAKAALSQTKETVSYGVVPLVTVAKTVAQEYPDLAEIQTTAGPIFEEKDPGCPVWEQDGDLSDLDANVGGGPLYDLCRTVLYDDEFQSSSERAVKAELERLDSIKSSSSSRSRKDGAAKVRSIESAFEDPTCFTAACYDVQAHAKLLQYVEALPDVGDKVIEALKQNYLEGVCADFTGRVTQYCLFRNEIEDKVFSIERKTNGTTAAVENTESDLPAYCEPIDSAARGYPTTILVCNEDTDDGGEKKMPLPTLRVVLSGGVGTQLARMWILCGGRCYEGGTRVNDDGTETLRQGDADGFLSHVEDNCLTICGIPFKKLDKKSEKQYLFARRKALTAKLEATNEPRDVLELTIMLLFQQVKSLVVSGPLLTGPILALLQNERKISEQVAMQLQQLANAVNTNATPDGALVTSIKACGLSRDISKHTVT